LRLRPGSIANSSGIVRNGRDKHGAAGDIFAFAEEREQNESRDEQNLQDD
jgi:hypothetical protein